MSDLPSVGALNTLDDVKNYLYKFERTMKYLLNGGLNTKNISEIGGWLVSEDLITPESGNVGLSSIDTIANDIRIWAGSSQALNGSAPYRVYEDGSMHSTAGFIGGWQILAHELRSATGLASMEDDGTITGVTIIGSTFTSVPTPGGGNVRINSNGMSLTDINGVSRVNMGNLGAGIIYGIQFMSTSGALDGMIYPGNGTLRILSTELNVDASTNINSNLDVSSTFQVFGQSFFQDRVWINGGLTITGGTIGGLLISHVTGLESNLFAIGSQLSNHSARISALESATPPPGP